VSPFVHRKYIFTGATALTRSYVSSSIGRGISSISLQNVACVGNESMLLNCSSSTTPVCDHTSDVGVRCRYTGENL